MAEEHMARVPFTHSLYIVNMCVCVCVCVHTHTHISDCVEIVYELLLLPNKTTVKHFSTNREWCEMLTGYLSLERRPGGDWGIHDIGQNVL